MKIVILSLLIIFSAISLGGLVKFLQYFVSDIIFLNNCSKVKGKLIRWTNTSHGTDSYRCSWWHSPISVSPVFSYYDTNVGAIQEHEAIIPKGCTLNEDTSISNIEIQYRNKHVRVSDERFVNNRVYYGFKYFIIFGLSLLAVLLLLTLYLLL